MHPKRLRRVVQYAKMQFLPYSTYAFRGLQGGHAGKKGKYAVGPLYPRLVVRVIVRSRDAGPVRAHTRACACASSGCGNGVFLVQCLDRCPGAVRARACVGGVC